MADPPARPRRYDDLLVIGGCPRSGTTFVQLLLHAAGLVDTANETHLLSQVVGPAVRRYRGFALQAFDGRRDVGPHVLIPRERYHAPLRQLVDEAVAEMRRRGGAAPLVCEKTPENILFWPEIAELLPGVRLIEVVRDPRAVYASTVAAGESWAGGWAAAGPAAFARRWVQFVRSGNALAASAVASTRIRYEKLVRAEPGYLRASLAKIGVTLTPERAAEARARTRIGTVGQMPRAAAPWSLASEPDGFFRRGEADAWRDELSPADAREIDAEAGDEMRRLGYRPLGEGDRSGSSD